MKKEQSKSNIASNKKKASEPSKSETSNKSLKTEFPLSEKDEVKQAEERMRLKNKSKKS